MLSTLAISNYRSIRSLVLPLTRLNLVTGPNGAGKSNLYRALRLLSDTALGSATASIAGEGSLNSVLWAGPERLSRAMKKGEQPVQGGPRQNPVSVKLGFSDDAYNYTIDFGLPGPVPRTFFDGDPEIKREVIWRAGSFHHSRIVMDRSGSLVKVRDDSGAWQVVHRHLPVFDSVLARASDPFSAPEAFQMRERILSWRFYDQFRTDRDAPSRMPQVGTRTPVLHHDGRDLPAAWQTILEIGDAPGLSQVLGDAFPGATVEIRREAGRFSLRFCQQGLLRPLEQQELSDGTLRYLCLAAALMTPRPPSLMVLNEPETSLHPELIPPLARLIQRASENTQLWVTSHCEPLIDRLIADRDCNHLALKKMLGETQLDNSFTLDEPPWRWPGR